VTEAAQTPEEEPVPVENGTASTEDAAGTAPLEGTIEAEFAALVEESETEQSDQIAAELAERTADLQRLSAEYANYRKRVERDRESSALNAKASLAEALLVVLDDVERAGQHGDLTGAFKAVADKLSETLAKAGLEPFAAEGDGFDPAVHEAVQHGTSPDVTEPTVTTVLRRGYRFGDKVLRPALVAVTDAE
jgi:molecular chaperone GrpE